MNKAFLFISLLESTFLLFLAYFKLDGSPSPWLPVVFGEIQVYSVF